MNRNIFQCHACGKKFRSYAAEAKHRHNFPFLCDKSSKRWREFQEEIAKEQERRKKEEDNA